MCVVSMVAEHYIHKWSSPPFKLPNVVPIPNNPRIPSQEEIDEFYALLERARKYDREHGQEDCELDDKRKALKAIAEEMGVEIKFI